ncbi:alpha-galactosidase [Bifidobacterium favimelis]|uniref:Alpha-galactosidase n=1 Tax=Bifidobacterium favimelis TaxID=3122979 RepID=A0ABU8ZPS7_9BIFI
MDGSHKDMQEGRVVTRYGGRSVNGLPLALIYMQAEDVGMAWLLVGDDLPRLVHWGGLLTHPASLLHSYETLHPQEVSGGLEQTPWPSVLPTQAEGWTGESRLVLSRAGMALCCRFTVDQVRLEDGGVSDFAAPDLTAPTLVVHAADREQGVGLTWRCQILDSGLVRQRMAVSNEDPGLPLEVGYVELGFPLPASAAEIQTTTGHHLRERSVQRQPFTIGRLERSSLVGRPDFDSSLLLCAGRIGFGFESGRVYATHLGWSGNGRLTAERLPYTSGIIGGAEILQPGEVTLPPAGGGQDPAAYSTPWLYGSCGEGLDAVAHRFHSFLRSLHPSFATHPRPVTLNTWEAVYFNHSYEKLAALAQRAARIGVERFVVDDGWFLGRRSDLSGLGDWSVDQTVWPDGEHGLGALAATIHGLGMEFGLWFEPEMISPDSVVFRAHPDWVLRPTPGRLPMPGRHQQVMDLTNQAAYEWVFNAMDGLVGSLGIDYIKWDHNKYVVEAISPASGRPAVHGQTLAVYRIMRDLKDRHPGLEIESCSSGGGRIDAGILEYADRVWVSDCVDPVERCDIQRYTSLLVPPEMLGEHVGDSPAHSTGRATSLQMREAMAFFGHLGVEWDLLKVPQEEVDELSRWIHEYRVRRPILSTGRVVHADTPDPAVRLDGVVAPDRSSAVYRFTQLVTSVTYPVAPVCLPGLDPTCDYRLRPLAPCLDLHGKGNGASPLLWWSREGVVMPGRALEDYGIRPPSLNPAQAVLFEAVREDGDPSAGVPSR